ncbi:hypothetical protein P12x_001468 [Tundrisphaera lichenicola]|uniref:hypothetical protein n=1 Tax=Tundrisphaera lichenicola TaxID=2029860 RepID=UPI003EB728EE
MQGSLIAIAVDINGVVLTKLDDEQALQRIGNLIDLAAMLGDENGLNVAVSWCDELQARSLDDPHRALFFYFEANAWSGLSGLRVGCSRFFGPLQMEVFLME